MCIGMPLQVVATAEHQAWCEAASGATLQRECLDMSLLGPQPVGTWVLAFQGAARQVLTATEAAQALAARQALAAVLQSQGSGSDSASAAASIDHFFADLVGRTPELPVHLRPVPSANTTGAGAVAVAVALADAAAAAAAPAVAVQP